MKDIDRMIEEALDGEEQALFRETAREPDFFTQAFGLLGGRNGWVNGLMVAIQAALFAASGSMPGLAARILRVASSGLK